MKYHEVEITLDMVSRANENTKLHGNNSHTIDKTVESRFAGYLGEEMLEEFMSGLTRENCKDYDFVRWKGTPMQYTIDVKTKRRKVTPADRWSVHINEYGNHQQCETYVFVSLLKADTKSGWRGWIIGWMDKKEYWDRARVVKEGDIEEKDGFREYADGRKLYFSELNHF